MVSFTCFCFGKIGKVWRAKAQNFRYTARIDFIGLLAQRAMVGRCRSSDISRSMDLPEQLTHLRGTSHLRKRWPNLGTSHQKGRLSEEGDCGNEGDSKM